MQSRVSFSVLTAFAIVFAFGATLVFLPCGISIILASWFALLTRPWMTWLATRLGGRTTAAALITTLVVIGFLGPALLAVIPIVFSAVQLANEVGQSQQWHDAAKAVVGRGNDADIMNLVRGQMANAWSVASVVLRTSATALFGVVMFVVSLFALSAHGEAVLAWLRDHSPLETKQFDRLAGVYARTGRGLVIGVGATALIQGALATLTYAVVGIPRALALGLLTTMFALVPGIGTVLVWGPVTVILAMGGYPGKAAIVAASGVLLIGSVDNFLKPILANRANLRLPAVLVFMTMLSGVVAFGPAGLILGPLLVCMAMEILAMVRERQQKGVSQIEPEPSQRAKSQVAPSVHV